MDPTTAFRIPSHRALARRLLSGGLAFVAWVAASVSLPAQIQVTEFTGSVTIVSVFDEAIEGTLAELGIVLGAPVTLEIAIDTSVPGMPDMPDDFTFYPDAVADFRVTVGSYEAFYHMPVTPMGNSALVGNNVPSPGIGPTDSYTFATLGAETPELLRGDGPFDVLGFNGVVSDATGKSMSNDGLTQNLKAFKFGSGAVGGSKGSVAFMLDMGKVSKKPSPLAVAQSGQLKSGGAFLRAVVQANAKATQKPSTADPRGNKLQAAIDKAVGKFGQQLTKIANKAAAKGVTPPLDLEDVPEFGDALLEDVESLVAAVTVELDPENPADRVLHGKLLRAVAKHLGADLGAHAAHLLKLPADKLAARLEKSRAAHLAAAAKAIAAAAKKGVDHAGPAPEDTADAVAALVDEIVALVEG